MKILLLFLGLLLSFATVFLSPMYVLGLLGLVISSFVFLKNAQMAALFLIIILPIIRWIAESTRLLPGSALSINILGIMNILIPILIGIHLLIHHIRLSSFKLSKPLAVFVIYLSLGILYSVSPFNTLREVFRILMPISFYFIISSLEINHREAKKFLYAILFSSIIPILIGIFQFVNQSCIDEQFGINRIFSTFGHPNVYSMFMVICILLTSYLYLSRNWFAGKIIFISYLGFLFFSLFNTFTRIGWGTCAFSLITLGMLMKKRFVVYVFASLVIILLLVSSVSNLFLERIKPDYSALSRLAFNQVSLSFFAKRPVLGAGLGTYQILSLDILGTRTEAYGKALGFAPHNDYFKFLVENGVIGLLLYLYLMYSCLRMGVELYKKENSGVKNYGAFLICLLLGIMLSGLTDAGFGNSSLYLCIILGVGEVYLRSLCCENSHG